MSISFRFARVDDVDALVTLINAAYRPAQAGGWTHEGKLVSGPRINAAQMRQTIDDLHSVVILALADNAVVACVHVQQQGADSYIGTLTVAPAMQNTGFGKVMLARAEQHAIEYFGARRLLMLVLSPRHELIDFYLRRGYVRMGVLHDFPVDAGVGIPMQPGMTLENLEKIIS